MKELSFEVLQLLEKEVTLLSKTPITIERQSVILDYFRVLRYWQVKDEAEPTSLTSGECSRYKRKWLQIYRCLVDLGGESLFDSTKEVQVVQPKIDV
jgi:hypothetical protein